MATITANLTTIADAETVTGWTGPTPALDSEVLKEGNNSVSFIVRNNGTQIYFSMTNQDYSEEHIRMWVTTGVYGLMETKALGGLRFFMYDGANTAYWNIAGKDTYAGGWLNICVYTESTPDSGTVNTASVDRIGVEFALTGSAKRVINTWVDYMRYGDGLQAESAASEYFGMEEIFLDDIANGYGIVEKFEGVYFLSGALELGDTVSTANCYYTDSNVDVKFTDKNVKSTLYKIAVAGNSTGTTDFVFKSGSIKAAGASFSLDFTDSNINDFTLSGAAIAQGREIYFSNDSGHYVTTNTFNSCGEIYPDLAEFITNIVSDTTGDNGLVFPTGTNNVSYCTFLNNGVATLYTAGGTYADDNNTYTNNTYDVENNSAGDVTINATGVSNISTSTNSGGGTVTILNTKQVVFEIEVDGVGITGYEWRLYEKNATPGIIGNVNLAGEENAASSTQTYNFTYSSDTDAVLQIIHDGYEESQTYFTLENKDKSFTINLTKEENI